MSFSYRGEELQAEIEKFAPGATMGHTEDAVHVDAGQWLDVAQGLKEREEFGFDALTLLTTVDYIDHFEVVYHLRSLSHNRTGVIKLRCGEGRGEASVPSVISVWRGADLQEREAYDLMGVGFDGHPNMKRLMLWEGFEGHPLRKDYVR
jgi:NADH-quinone oxidoreductase subunit C